MADVRPAVDTAPTTPNKAASAELQPATPLAQLKNIRLESLSKATPMGSSSHGPEAGFKTVDEEAGIVEAELSGSIHRDEEFAKKAFIGDVPNEGKIQRFLEECDLYDIQSGRWKDVPEVAQLEHALYKPFCDIIQAVINHFGYTAERAVLDTHRMMMNHVSGNGNPAETNQLKTSPDITIKGFGKNYSPKAFKVSKKAAGSERVDYLRCTSPLEVKTKANRNFRANLIQVAIYARQCFMQQHNRRAVYSLIMTEECVVLYMFDRSGVNHSVDVDIHKDATTFVRFILGVVSPKEKVVGFDTNIYWEGEDRFLKTTDSEGNDVTYKLAKPYPVFYRRAVRSRGTCCWKAIDPNTNDIVLIKDAWRASLRKPETEYLAEIKRLQSAGVVQMISCEVDEEDTTANMRRIDLRSLTEGVTTFHNRTFSRIVFVDGGQPVEYFKSKAQLLYAFRDAIAGHCNLWRAGILHRDISINNILVGYPDSPEGYRGVVIDLDLAILTLRKSSCWGSDFRTGTRAFQSVNVLKSYDDKQGKFAPHDYLDDLESFYYVLCWICIGYSAPGVKVNPFPQVLLDWENENPRSASLSKDNMSLRRAVFDELVTDYFGPIFCRLLERLHGFFRPHVERKGNKPPNDGWPSLEELQPEAEKDYKTVLDIFDDAIVEYEKEEAAQKAALPLQPPVTVTATSPNPSLRSPLTTRFPPQPVQHDPFNHSLHPTSDSPLPDSSSRKRRSDSDDEGSPKPKKTRSSYRPPLTSPGSPTASTRRSLTSRPARPSKLHLSESHGEI